MPRAPDRRLCHLFFSRFRTALFAFASRVMVEGLAPVDDETLLAPRDPWTPREIASLRSTFNWGLGLPVVSVCSLAEKH